MQILLMIVFSIIKRCGISDFRGDFTIIIGSEHRSLKTIQTGAGGGILLRRQWVNCGAILRAMVIALTHSLRGIVILPEYLQQLLIAEN